MHQKKLDDLVINERINDGIRKNLNQTITNMSDIELNDDEIAVLFLLGRITILYIYGFQI